MSNQLKKSIDEYSATAQIISNILTVESPIISPKIPISIQPKYLDDILKEKWTKIASDCNKEITEVKKGFSKIKKLQNKFDILLNKQTKMLTQIKENFVPAVKRTNWVETKNLLIEKWERDGISSDKQNDMLYRIESTNYATLKKTFEKTSTNIINNLEKKFKISLTYYSGIYYAFLISKFNKKANFRVYTRFKVKEYCATTEKKLKGKTNEIKKNLAVGDLKAANYSASSLVQFCENELRKKALSIAASVHQKQLTSNNKFKLIRDALRVGETIRNLIFLAYTGRYVEFITNNRHSVLTSNWTKMAFELSKNQLEKMPKVITISALNNNPDKYDKQFISVEGMVDSVLIKHTRLKVISTVAILGKTGKIITVTLPYIKIDSGGIVPGTYVKLAGMWQLKNKEANGNPALALDRHNLSELSKNKWIAWVRLQMVNIYQVIPHNLNAIYSLSPGKDGAINPIRYLNYYSDKN